MRIVPGCFSVLALMVAACLCVGIVSAARASHNRPFASVPGRALQAPPADTGRYSYYYGEYSNPFFRTVGAILGGSFALALIFCMGAPVTFILLGLTLFFYTRYRRERELRETVAAQYARSQVPWDEPPQSI